MTKLDSLIPKSMLISAISLSLAILQTCKLTHLILTTILRGWWYYHPHFTLLHSTLFSIITLMKLRLREVKNSTQVGFRFR